ncbi:DUF4255 domain-containing protein [Nakamurella sp.]|uniref:DUF4255 domain-containing protein n=1 Tax=Nakamurella sp. TaxID=1869182 RepID=UPI003B3AC7AB
MIPEVDVALRSLIEREAIAGTEVEVLFDAPTKDWAGRRNVPTIDVYLYDIREDLRRRERGLINEYDDRDRVRARHLPPRHFKLSYLVTAWTQRPEDEHRLLAALLSCFLRHDALPTEFLTGPLAEMGLPVPVTVALPPPEDRSFADVWSALGGELKPSLDVVVSAPTDTGQQYHAGPPVVQPPTIALGGLGGAGAGAGGSGGPAWPPREDRQQLRPLAVGPDDEPPVPGGDGADGADGAGSTARSTARTARSRSGGTGATGGTLTTAMVRGLSWQQLADSGRRTGTAAGDTTGPASETATEPAAHADATEPDATEPDAPRKPRRRRSSGLDQR